ncbi:thioesterase family protein [Neobacillus drentensis]|uniref:acyl-CoA thioesterase n=1 Tax=Neobacillus drentensis TaxID=220684 RepID=UPI0030001413
MAFTEREIIAQSDFYHVSNVKLYEYLDDARSEWYKYSVFIGVESVLVHISADFKKEIFDRDRLRILTALERIGNTSFTLKQTVMNQRDEQVVTAEVVLATIDREKRTKVTVPNEIRKLMEEPLDLEVYLFNKNP